MQSSVTYHIEQPKKLKKKMLHWASSYNQVCFLNSNDFKQDNYNTYDCILAVGATAELLIKEETDAFEKLKEFQQKHKSWLFGAFTYDLKNTVEKLSSENIDHIDFPLMHFFIPELLFTLSGNELSISSSVWDKKKLNSLLNEILDSSIKTIENKSIHIHSRISKENYLKTIEKIQQHIQRGDIYEMNFCQEFFAENANIDPIQVYLDLNEMSPTPFSCFYRYQDKYLLSSSPERFLKKQGQKIISQPIKGTAKRGNTEEEDLQQKEFLQHNQKDKTENIMIVDLVRNDLSRTAKYNSVKVEELCKIYTFKQVHQMISTVSSSLKEDIHFTDAIKEAFPMGSMTGAPKVKAMKLIEEFETTKRGLFSGAVGYITPDEDFDFNVIIRSAIYNASSQYLSFMAGSAITSSSEPETEYEECMVKAKAFFDLFGS